MRSLLLAPTLPSDAGNGLAMRIGIFLEALRGLGEVEVVVVPVFGEGPATNPLCQRLDVAPITIPVSGRADTHYSLLLGLADPRARLGAFQAYGKPSASAFVSIPVVNEIRSFLGERAFDLVHIARSYLLPAIAAFPEKDRPSVSVDLDDDDVETYRRIGALYALRGDPLAGEWQDAEASAFERLISRWLPRTDASFIATELAGETVEARYGVRPVVARNAVAIPPVVGRTPEPRSLLFVGGFDYFPNFDAAMFLIEAVLPILRAKSGGPVSLNLVGRNAPRRLRDLASQPGIRILDDVNDIGPVYGRSSIAVAPLRAGGGSRIKLLEAAAHSIPAVATPLGAEGTGLTDPEHVWLGETPEALADAALRIWNMPEESARRVDAAKAFVEANNSRDRMISTLAGHFATQRAGRIAHPGGRLEL